MSLFLMVSKQDYSGCLGKFNNYDSLWGGGGGPIRDHPYFSTYTFYTTPVSTYTFGLIINNLNYLAEFQNINISNPFRNSKKRMQITLKSR